MLTCSKRTGWPTSSDEPAASDSWRPPRSIRPRQPAGNAQSPIRNGAVIMLVTELGIAAILIIVNGLLSMSELAIVSSRPARLLGLVEKGVKGSRRALALASEPGKFLSTVQIGITLIGVLSGAFSGATL